MKIVIIPAVDTYGIGHLVREALENGAKSQHHKHDQTMIEMVFGTVEDANAFREAYFNAETAMKPKPPVEEKAEKKPVVARKSKET